jgi:hypothetical protein
VAGEWQGRELGVADLGARRVIALALSSFVRYHPERAIERTVMAASALAGGMAFISSTDIAYLLAASRALAFHPPSRASARSALAEHMKGGALVL